MRVLSNRSTTALRAAAILILLAGAPACGGKSPAAPSSPGSDAVVPPDMVLGSASAPVTMIEYSSLTCSHCADFHAQTLPLIKSDYIDQGKVKLIYRDYPLDNGAALSAAMVARCSGDRFFTVVDLLYQSQATWAGSSNVTSALKSVVAPTGMTSAEVDACLARTDLRAGIQAERTAGTNTYGITGTPTFIITNNGQQVVGAMPYGTFDAIFKKLLEGG
jgi:protein-disulfide isomerase